MALTVAGGTSSTLLAYHANEAATRNPRTLDPSLTLTRTQYPATVTNAGKRKPFVYAGYAIPCTPLQPLTAHS